MPKTLLAVDDSVTMRKVVEMTFAGEDMQVTTVATAQDALAACRRQRPDVVLADVALDGHSGYDLCRAIKDELPGIPVIILSSKQNPFDPARGQASGADGNLDKPYDTAKAIELVKKTLERGHSVAPSPIAAAQAMGAAPAKPMFSSPTQQTPAPVIAAAVARPAPTPPHMHATVQGMPQAAATSGEPRPPSAPALGAQATRRMEAAEAPPSATTNPALRKQATPALQRQHTVRMASDAPPAAEVQHGTLAELAQVPGGGNGGASIGAELHGKLQQLGLTAEQVDAVVSLSRDVVERVVWEVVPQLAETMVKEEIARLMREGDPRR